MNYCKKIEKGKMQELVDGGRYRELTKLIVDEIDYNYESVRKIVTSGKLEKIWNEVAYIPDLEEMAPEAEKSLLDYVIVQRAMFRTALQKI